MLVPPPTASTVPALFRALAGVLAFLIFALGMAVQSPSLHAWLHELGAPSVSDSACDHVAKAAPAVPHGNHDFGCVVDLIASGLTAPLAAPLVGALRLGGLTGKSIERELIAPAAAGGLYPPSHAPPARA